MIVYILVAIMHVHGGATTSFQEFHSKEQCEYTASLIKGSVPDYAFYRAFCVKK